MNIVRWEPFREMVSLRQAMDKLFEDSFVRPLRLWPELRGGEFPVDMYQTKDEDYLYKEQRYGALSRSVTIPVKVDSDKAKAIFEDGVLTLTLPKSERVKPKSIKVKAKGIIEGKE